MKKHFCKIKRLGAFVMAFMLVLQSTTLQVKAAPDDTDTLIHTSTCSSNDNQYNYEVYQKEDGSKYGLIKKATSLSSDVTFPETVDDGSGTQVPVKVIGDGSSKIASSMAGCTSIAFHSNIEEINYRAFDNTGLNLQELNIPLTVKVLGDYSFGNNTFGKVIINGDFNGDLKNSYNSSFLSSTINEIEIKEGVTEIPGFLFASAKLSGVTSLIFPSTLETIGKSAFNTSTLNLQELNIPSSVKNLSDYSFGNATFGKVIINGDMTTAGNYSSFQWSTVNEIDIKEGVTKIPDYLFASAKLSGVTSLIFPTTLQTIGNSAFCNSTLNIPELNIPKSVKSLGEDSFDNCTFEKVIINGDITTAGESVGPFSLSTINEIDIKEGVTKIPNHLFNNAKLGGVTSLIFPGTLQTIGERAFLASTLNISELNIPASVNSLGESSFRDATFGKVIINGDMTTAGSSFGSAFKSSTVNEIDIKEGVTKIPSYLFYDAKLGEITSLDFPSTLQAIGNDAFHTSTLNISELDIPASVKSLGNYSFGNATFGKVIINGDIPISFSYPFYSSIVNGIEFKEGITVIPSYLLCQSKLDNVTTITVPETVTSIGNYAFYGNTQNPSLEVVINTNTGSNTASNWSSVSLFKSAPAKISIHKGSEWYDYFTYNIPEASIVSLCESSPNSDWILDNEADCVTDGKEHKECTVCGGEASVNITPATGHTESDWIVDTPATCTTNGTKHKECTVCHTVLETETILAAGHDFDYANATYITIDHEDGSMDYQATAECKNCDATTSQTKPVQFSNYVNPTCENDGSVLCRAEFDAPFTPQEKTEVLPATGHAWVQSNYVEAKCEEDGHIDYVCQNNPAHIRSDVLPATGHLFDETDPEWSIFTGLSFPNGYSSVEHICKHDMTHKKVSTVTTTKRVLQEATCTEQGQLEVTNTSVMYPGISKTTVFDIPIIDHNYGFPTYTWNNDYTSCTATRTCVDCGHEDTETVASSSTIKTAATCLMNGIREFVADFIATYFDTQTYEQQIDAFGHDYESVVTTPADCEHLGVRTFTCKNDPTHIYTEPIEMLGHDWDEGEEIAVPTCTTEGTIKYTCKRDPSHTKEVSIPVLGHDYEFSSFTWNEDGTSATANYKCCRNQDHVYNATCTVTSSVKTPATCTQMGTTTYTAVSNYDSTINVGTKDVQDIPMTAHNYGFPTYEWNSDHSKCTATRTCADCGHEDTETVNSTNVINYAATCLVDGLQTYFANFVSTYFVDQEFEKVLNKLGHDWNDGVVTTEPTCFEKGIKTFTCQNDPTHTYIEDIAKLPHTESDWIIDTPATCIEDGTKHKECTVCHEVLHTESIDKTGHTYGEKELTWNDDNSGGKGTVICENCGHEETETVSSKETIIKNPTCTENGLKHLIVEFKNPHLNDRLEKDVPISKLGHESGKKVVENEIAATYEKEGSYDEVVYCNRCHTELERNAVVIPKLEKEPEEEKPEENPTKPEDVSPTEPEDVNPNRSEESPTKPEQEPVIIPQKEEPVVEKPVEETETPVEDTEEAIDDEEKDTPEEDLNTEITRDVNTVIPYEEETTREDNIKKVAIVTTSVGLTSGGTFAFLFFLFWWRRRKVKGHIASQNNEVYRIELLGKDNLFATTDEHGDFEFKNLKEDTYLLNIYDMSENQVFSAEIYTKGKEIEDVLNIINNDFQNYGFDYKRKVLTLDFQ